MRLLWPVAFRVANLQCIRNAVGDIWLEKKKNKVLVKLKNILSGSSYFYIFFQIYLKLIF